MSRTIIVGLAVIVVAALSFIVIGAFNSGDVEDMAEGQGQVEVTPEAEEQLAEEVPSAVNDPAADVQDEAMNADSDPIEQQVENAADNSEAPAEDAAMPDAPATEIAEGDDATVVVSEDAAEALDEAAQDDTAPQVSETEGTAVPETEALTEDDATTEQSATDAELATDAIGAAASDDAAAEATVEGVDPATVPANDEELAAMLTPETFDADAITAYVLQSDALDQVSKDALVVALQQAREEPAFVDAAILSIRRRFDIAEPQATE